MIRFSLIQKGLIEITPEEGIRDSRPTSSLLECNGFKAVIDTEHPKNDKGEFTAALRALGCTPEEIGCVILTHLHPDHFGHKDLFPSATFVFHRDEKFSFYFARDRKLELNGDALLELTPRGIESPEYIGGEPDLAALGDRLYLRHIPGHTPGSLMILAEIDGLVHAWAGDTFLNRDYYERWHPPGSSWDQQRVYGHMEYVRDRADVIIPGHGAPFPTAGHGLF